MGLCSQLIDLKRLEEIGVDSIRVSIYGNNPQSYNAVHGTKNTGLFQRIKENLTEISRIRKDAQLFCLLTMW